MTAQYLLDTNAVSDLVRQPQGRVAMKIAEVGESAVATSIVVAAELRYRAAKKGAARLANRVDDILSRLLVLSLESPIDQSYAKIRVTLEATGKPIGANDLLIAAHALTLGMVLVSDNLREFRRVKGLKVENWMR